MYDKQDLERIRNKKIELEDRISISENYLFWFFPNIIIVRGSQFGDFHFRKEISALLSEIISFRKKLECV